MIVYPFGAVITVVGCSPRVTSTCSRTIRWFFGSLSPAGALERGEVEQQRRAPPGRGAPQVESFHTFPNAAAPDVAPAAHLTVVSLTVVRTERTPGRGRARQAAGRRGGRARRAAQGPGAARAAPALRQLLQPRLPARLGSHRHGCEGDRVA